MKRAMAALLLALMISVPAMSMAAPKARAKARPAETLLRAVEVLVNGTAMPANPPVKIIANRIYIPVRAIFSALGVDIEHQGKSIVAHVGAKTIQMSIGSSQAYVDGQPIDLGEPISEFDGTTYVPLRFVKDALGAQASYDAHAAQIEIVSALVGKTESRPLSSGNTITGAVTAIDRNSAPATVTVTRGSSVRTISINSDAKIVLQDVTARTTTEGSLADIQAGDALTATLNKDGAVEQIVDLFASRSGTISAVSASSFVLGNGRVITPTATADLSLNGQGARLGDLKVGDAVTIRSNPETGEIRQIVASRKDAGTAAPASEVQITSFSITSTKPLKAGESFEALMTGTPGGHASFDIGMFLSAQPMQETSPGEYRGTYTVPNGVNFTQVAVYGHLTVGSSDAPRAQARTPLTVATIPPQVTDVAPPGGQTVNNAQPSIFATFATPTDIGINPSSIVLVVNGHDVTAAATRTSTFITYSPGVSYPDGSVQVTVRVADAAGNTTTRTWTFTIKTH